MPRHPDYKVCTGEWFFKRYRWEDENSATISTLFWQKCAARTKDNLSKERAKALYNANIDYPTQGGELYMHKYNPWWCSADIWTQMCEKWTEEDWLKRISIDWVDVYVATRDGLPDAIKTARYPEGTERPDFDQELWEMATVVKKNYVKGQGQRRRPSFRGSFNGSELLLILGGHLGAIDPEALARAVEAATASRRADDTEVYCLVKLTLFFVRVISFS
ncbi:hypothetical protein DCAR_0311623 [Daucus carota subsp. sativus]|uniref:Uncharacterized protein n=1 Tax=Daucus carota subsp. sativus TaxID=79200 RepID=A0AAF0WMK6_DAUCS|nr:hypothetical protein DCAR_0311623 [Daucus carota subsp. sativus]